MGNADDLLRVCRYLVEVDSGFVDVDWRVEVVRRAVTDLFVYTMI